MIKKKLQESSCRRRQSLLFPPYPPNTALCSVLFFDPYVGCLGSTLRTVTMPRRRFNFCLLPRLITQQYRQYARDVRTEDRPQLLKR